MTRQNWQQKVIIALKLYIIIMVQSALCTSKLSKEHFTTTKSAHPIATSICTPRYPVVHTHTHAEPAHPPEEES